MKTLPVLVLIGCGTSVTPIVAPNGGRGFAIECRGTGDACLEAAGERCPAGYDVLEKSQSTWSGTARMVVACR